MCIADSNENKQNWGIELRRKLSKTVCCLLLSAITNQSSALKSSEVVRLRSSSINEVAFITNHFKLLAIVSMRMPTYLNI